MIKPILFTLALALYLVTVNAATDKVEGIVSLPLATTTKGHFQNSNEALIYRTDLSSINEKQTYFVQYGLQSDKAVCIYVRYGLPATVNPPRYLESQCTNSTHKQITFGVETHLFQSGGWFSTVISQESGDSSFSLTAFNTTHSPQSPPTKCPLRAATWTAAGPYAWKNYCWYLGLPGRSCDAVCKGLGGSNLATFAQHAFSPICLDRTSCNSRLDEPIVYFYNNGNPLHWTSLYPSVQHTLGYGLTRNKAFCHCLTGHFAHGSFPGEANDISSLGIACPCFAVKQT